MILRNEVKASKTEGGNEGRQGQTGADEGGQVRRFLRGRLSEGKLSGNMMM